MPTQLTYHFLAQLPGVHVRVARLGALGSSPVCTVCTSVPKRCLGGCSHRGTAIMPKWRGSLSQADPITKPRSQQANFLKIFPYLLLGTHLGAPSHAQLPSCLRAVCKCTLTTMHAPRCLIHCILNMCCPSAAAVLR